MIQYNHFDYKTLLNGVNYKIAQSTEDKTLVCETVYNAYLKQGYINKDNQHTNLFSYSWLPHAKSFLATHEEKIIFTATVIPDSPAGLPMDALFKNELDSLRDKKICEVSMLAGDMGNTHSGPSLRTNIDKRHLLFHLFEHIFQYVKGTLQYDYICVAIHPKHADAYKSLLFKELGPVKPHTHLNDTPALPRVLDVAARAEKYSCRLCFNEGQR